MDKALIIFIILTLDLTALFVVILHLITLLHNQLRIKSHQLTHQDLIHHIQDLGITSFDNGLCFGFTINWALSVPKQTEEIFYKQIDLLRQYKNTLSTTVKKLHKKKNEATH